MKPSAFIARVTLLQLIAVASITTARAVVFTTDTSIGTLDTSYDGQDVVVSNCTVTIDGEHAFNSVRLADGGILTHTLSLNGLSLTISNNLQVELGGAINLSGRGFEGNSGTGNGGEAGSPQSGAGAGHGGYGGLSSSNALGGNCYGVFDQPVTLGSGGGQGATGIGGAGGGAIKLVIGGSALIEGDISANGANATNSRSGGGSGGSLWIVAQTVTGAGTITANGGNGEPIHGGGGGGGRIAIHSDTNNFTGTITAFGGQGWKIGGAGTIYTKPTASNGLLLVDNGGNAGTNSLVSITNQADVVIRGRAGVIPTGACIARDVMVASNSAIVYAIYSPSTSISASQLIVEPTAAVEADGRSSVFSVGTGNPGPYAGGGLGGSGGNSSNGSGGHAFTYQAAIITTPIGVGMGGGGTNATPNTGGGSGGGAIRLIISNDFVLNGCVTALGRDSTTAGGGSGGSIWIDAGRISGDGLVSVNGGNGHPILGGGGGGGCIALYVGTNLFTGSITAFGGGGVNRGGAGDIYQVKTFPAGATTPELIIDNGGFLAPNTSEGSFIPSFTVPPNIIIRNGAEGRSYAGSIPSLLVGSNCSLTLQSQLTVTSNVVIQSGAAIHLDGTGTVTTGAGGIANSSGIYYSGGGGHGGYGGSALGGNYYGSISSPTTAGSKGGGNGSFPIPTGGLGGGALRLTVNGSLTNDGRISANGKIGSGQNAGGGAGGSVWLTLGKFYGSGLISANGGPGILPGGGGGGGGRIAITCNSNFFTGGITAYGGSGTSYGGAGTIYLQTNPNIGTVFVDNGGNTGTNTPLETSFTGDLTVSGGGKVMWSFFANRTLRNVWVKTNGSVSFQSTLTLLGNMTIDAGGEFSLDGRGSPGGTGSSGGSGSTGINPKGGAGHGGYGALSPVLGAVYGSITSPSSTGSGGGNGSGSSFSPLGGSGGGAMRLIFSAANSVLTVNGRLSANGLAGELNSGGGSGGSLWLSPVTLAGSGIISANGGDGNGPAGGGGGGRISISYSTNLFTGQITAYGGAGGGVGGAGTIYLKPNSAAFGTLLINNGSQSGTNTPLSSSLGLPPSPFNLTIGGGASVFALTQLPQLSNLVINTSSILTMRANETNVFLNVLRDATLASGSFINVNGKGFGPGLGVGAGATLSSQGSGGGYGGAGGNSSAGAVGGTNYGPATKPVDRGSGGGSGANTYFGGSEGGGAVQMIVGGTLSLDGSVSANGNPGLQDDSGGGSGGSIWITAGALTGTGNISATGGDGDLFGGGGGGGGRIAIYAPSNTFAGGMSVSGGLGANSGQAGSIFISTNLLASVISGTVTNLQGNPQQGALIQPTGYAATTTDMNGNYVLELPVGWTGSVTPSLGTNVFVPSTRSYTSLNFDIPNANFLTVPSVTPVLGSSVSGTNLVFNWSGVLGVAYLPYWSTNLSDWLPIGGWIQGSNGVMQLLIPANDVPYKFVRVRALH